MASKLFGADTSLLTADGNRVPASSLDGTEVLGLYFSAHWCPPCRGFTPRLCEFLAKFKASDKASRMDLVFVSSDRDQGSFDEYHREMNFYALPFDQRALKDQLSAKFGVQGIPTLVLVDQNGEVITTKGRAAVMEDPEAARFPWKPRSLQEIMASTELVDNKGGRFPASERLNGHIVALYFSAHWCPPCRGFTPELVKTYNKLKAAGKPFEVVFVSSDHTDDEFNEYLGTMPWLALPYEARDAKAELSDMFDVEGIPTLLILDENLKMLNDEGRAAVGSDPEGANFPWRPRQVDELTGATVSQLNKSPVLIGFTDATEAEVARVRGIFEAVAPAFEGIKFFYTNNDDAIDLVRDFARLPESAKLVLLDIPSQGKYLAADNALSQENITAFAAAYKAGSLEKQKIR